MDKQLIIDYQETFNAESGKRVLADMKKKANYNFAVVPKDNLGHTDIYEVMRNEGKRSVIVHIESMLQKDPNKETGSVVNQEMGVTNG